MWRIRAQPGMGGKVVCKAALRLTDKSIWIRATATSHELWWLLWSETPRGHPRLWKLAALGPHELKRIYKLPGLLSLLTPCAQLKGRCPTPNVARLIRNLANYSRRVVGRACSMQVFPALGAPARIDHALCDNMC